MQCFKVASGVNVLHERTGGLLTHVWSLHADAARLSRRLVYWYARPHRTSFTAQLTPCVASNTGATPPTAGWCLAPRSAWPRHVTPRPASLGRRRRSEFILLICHSKTNSERLSTSTLPVFPLSREQRDSSHFTLNVPRLVCPPNPHSRKASTHMSAP